MGELTVAPPFGAVIVGVGGAPSWTFPGTWGICGTCAVATLAMAVGIPVSGLSTKLGNAETTADDKGAWQASITYNIPIKTSGTKIVLEAVATNTLTGQASGAAKVEVVPKM